MSTFRDLLDRLPAGVGLTLDAEACRALRDELGDGPDLQAVRRVGVERMAFVLGRPVSTVRRLCASGALPAVKRGKRWTISETDLLDFANRAEERQRLRVTA